MSDASFHQSPLLGGPAPVFDVEATDGNARAGRLRLARGTIETPIFMPVGTVGSVKMMDPTELNDVGAQIILGNTYHLYLRPGKEVLEHAGGLHRWMGWDKPMLTDSGGFQFSRCRTPPSAARTAYVLSRTSTALITILRRRA